MFPLRDNIPATKTPFITYIIVLINAWVFWLEITTVSLPQFVEKYALIPSLVDWGNLYSLQPFITSLFLHSGWVHLISNMWFLWIFGNNVESVYGHIKFLIYYLFFGVAAGILQYVIDPSSTIPTLGASGAIAGVLGSYLVFFPYAKVEVLIPVFIWLPFEVPAVIMLIYWFITQLFSGVASLGVDVSGGVAWWAHVGGFVSGFFLARLNKQPDFEE